MTSPSVLRIDRKHVFLLILFFMLVYILPLGARDLMVPDETRYGEIPREMIDSGNWIVPHLDGARYFEKPPLGYWVHAGAILLFGENNFAVRFPSAIAVGMTALLIFILVGVGGRTACGKDAFPAMLSVLVYISCLEVVAVGNIAVLDSLFSFFLTASICFFYFASEAKRSTGRERWMLIASGAFCGLAFLTKGFLAFVLPILVLAPFLVFERRYLDIFRMSLLPILVAVLVVLPWGIMIHLKEPDFWRFFFWNEHIRRFMAEDAQHKASFWFFFLAAPGAFFPWTFLIPATVPGLKTAVNGQNRLGRLLRLAMCWLVIPFLFFSYSNGKLLTYILPCFPPFAILIAFGLFHIVDDGEDFFFLKWGLITAATAGCLILVAFVYIQFYGDNGMRPFGQSWKSVMMMNGLLFFVLFSVFAIGVRKGKQKVFIFGFASILLFFVAHFIIPDQTIVVKSPGPFLMKYANGIGKTDVVVSDEESVRAVCWYFRRKDVFLLEGAGELDYGLRYEDADGRWLDLKLFADLIRENPGETILIARAGNIMRWRDRLPKPVYQDASGPDGYVLWKY